MVPAPPLPPETDAVTPVPAHRGPAAGELVTVPEDGWALMVMVNATAPALHPSEPLSISMVPLYVPGAAPEGTVMDIGDTGKDALVTSANPCACAVASNTILYISGDPD